MTAVVPAAPAGIDRVVSDLLRYLESGVAPDGLYADDVFLDITFPQWRLQADDRAGALAIRSSGHPSPGRVHVERLEPTATGFTVEIEERWEHEGQRWYCREMLRADVVDGRIVELKVYCTGDWDEARQREHAAAVRLLRP